jgi:hypothetical protein
VSNSLCSTDFSDMILSPKCLQAAQTSPASIYTLFMSAKTLALSPTTPELFLQYRLFWGFANILTRFFVEVLSSASHIF